jgi:OFA family oxalate/formate antiporter-like MFS transporter
MKVAVKNRYIVLVMGMIIQLCAGIIYMWSVFKGPVSTHLSWDSASASITSSIMLAAFVIGIIIGGRMQDKYSPAPVALAGSIFLGLGMILSFVYPPIFTMAYLYFLRHNRRIWGWLCLYHHCIGSAKMVSG